jgi:hypothetical protein
MRTYQHTDFTDLDRYDTLYAVHKSDMICCKADTKATPASVQGIGVDFEIYMDFASPQRCGTCS